MTSLRRALWTATVMAFVAGVAVGIAVPMIVEAAASRPLSPEQEFVDNFARTYDLTAEQRRQLLAVLEHRRRERFELVSKHYDNMPPEFIRELRDVMDRSDVLISALLTEDQRTRYQLDSNRDRAGGAAQATGPEQRNK